MPFDLGPNELTVAMITMNEERAIAKVLGDIRRVAPNAEVLVVDSSRDRTAELAEALGARVIRQVPPRGYGPAMLAALKSANGRCVVTLDCDDTYPTEMIPRFARWVLEDGYELVDGARLAAKPEAMPWLNYFANVGFASVASMLFGTRIHDLHSGMRAYAKTLIDSLVVDPNGAALPVELLLVPLSRGARVKVVFIEYRDRLGESTLRPLSSAWWTARRLLRARRARERHGPWISPSPNARTSA